jgi:aminoglycoside/choline kinase family phosphotransferase
LDKTALHYISTLFEKWSNEKPVSIDELPPSGSYRRYFRIQSIKGSFIGVYNNDLKENIAFCTFTSHFESKNLNVPSLLAEDMKNNVYLLRDLGDVSLLSFLQDNNFEKEITNEIRVAYKKVIDNLPLFQIKGGEGLDYSKCYPRQAFDKLSMMWDLNYFKYYFLKLTQVPFYEQDLEDDYQSFSDYLLTAPSDFFMYRDFQSRNIMLVDGAPYFIDYQGGRKGALQYDIASLLFESKTALPASFREEMLKYYMEVLAKYITFDKKSFLQYYYGFVYIRLMQAMGAYGFRGLYEKKELFLQSIPPALAHLEWLHEHAELPLELPALRNVWEHLIKSVTIKQLAHNTQERLAVNINSFSYRRNIPADDTNNGGGYVFDCRGLVNPGKLDQYKDFTGRDPEIHEFFRNDDLMKSFLSNVIALVDQNVENYRKRGFKNLMVNFGCTGGQHRSVYCAEMLYYHLKEKFNDIDVHIRHREQELKS